MEPWGRGWLSGEGLILSPEVAEAVEIMPRGLREHTHRVRGIAVGLAPCYDIDPHKADLAAAAHDLARAMRPKDLLAQAREFGLQLHPVEEALPLLLHGPVATHWLRWNLGVEDPEVLEAVRWHSTATRGLSPLAKLTFLADKLDPQKQRRYPFLEQVRALAAKDLDAAMLEFLEQESLARIRKGQLVHPGSIEARNELLAGRQGL